MTDRSTDSVNRTALPNPVYRTALPDRTDGQTDGLTKRSFTTVDIFPVRYAHASQGRFLGGVM